MPSPIKWFPLQELPCHDVYSQHLELEDSFNSVIGQSDKFFFANLSRTGFLSNLLTEGILFPKRKASAAHQLEILR